MDETIAEALARRDAFRRKMEHALTFEERARRLFERMASNYPGKGMLPEGYQHFFRRNLRARAIEPLHDPHANKDS